MGKLNLAKYDPKDDSSPGTAAMRGSPDILGVILDHTEGRCLCGCGQAPAGPKSLFRMGHDARYRGTLIRAYITDTPITDIATQDTNGEENVFRSTRTAMQAAEALGWGEYLKVAKEREDLRTSDRANRANQAVLSRATGPQVGDRKLIRVGRWDYTGQVVAVWENGEEVEFEYVTKGGDIKRVTKSKEEAAG